MLNQDIIICQQQYLQYLVAYLHLTPVLEHECLVGWTGQQLPILTALNVSVQQIVSSQYQ